MTAPDLEQRLDPTILPVASGRATWRHLRRLLREQRRTLLVVAGLRRWPVRPAWSAPRYSST